MSWTIIAILGVVGITSIVFALGNRRPPSTESTHDLPDNAVETDQHAQAAKNLQVAYWSPDPDALAWLRSQPLDALTWEERLRLLHLACLDLLSQDSVRQQLMSDEITPMEAPEGPNQQLINKLLRLLLSEDSPYRRRHVAVRQRKAGEPEQRDPDLNGLFSNASLTHLGCLEVFRLGPDQAPVEVCFVPFDDLREVAFAGSTLFRYAKLFYDDGREDEVVLVPLLYGISWQTGNEFDRDGSLTRFVCHLLSEDGRRDLSIGVGHQDFVVEGEQHTLFGLGSVEELMVSLSVSDRRFEMKCRVRGLDPTEVRQSVPQRRP